MMILRFPVSFSLAAALAMGALASPALAQPAAQVGTLSCDVSAGVGALGTQRSESTRRVRLLFD